MDTYISSVQSLSRVQLFATPWTAALQASLSITNCWSLLKLMCPLTHIHTYFNLHLNVMFLSVAHYANAKLIQSCLTLCDLIDGSPPGSSIHRTLQARTLEWVAISFSLPHSIVT